MRAVVPVVVFLIAVGPAALAQGDDEPEGKKISEELRRIGDQMEAVARASGDLYWISIGASVASIGVMGCITLYLIRRQLGHMDRDAEVRRRPILSWSKFENGKMYNIHSTDKGMAITIRLVNAGHIAALSVRYAIKTIKGDDVSPLGATTGVVGTLAPNAHTEIPVMVFKKGCEPAQGGAHLLHVDLEYETIEKKHLETKLKISYDNGQMGMAEEHS